MQKNTMRIITRACRSMLPSCTLAAALALALAAAGSTSLLPVRASHAQSATASMDLPDFTGLVEQVGPSVVNIRTLEKRSTRRLRGNIPGMPGMDEETLELLRRFGFPVPGVPRQQRPQEDEEAQPRGLGSGFILTADGYVMTNAHVVEGADEVIVTLTDKREFKARIIGSDKRTDVAVVKIEAQGLPAVKIGDVERVKVGEWVMAIGSPFGLENTVTAGIVSAKQRDTGDYLPAIQTDVAINPGNSGGPLINLRGEVIGINSQIYSRSGGFMGISFAIPIDAAVQVSDQLRASGRVTRGRIGVQIGPVPRDVAESMGLDSRGGGALVSGVEPDSPAARAGLEPGDIITHFDGRAIERVGDLPRLVGGTKPGTRSTITVFRRGKSRELNLLIAEIPPDEGSAQAQADPASGKTLHAKALGLTLGELGAEQKKALQLRGGVRVMEAEGAAERAGLREGDVILQLANTEISNLQSFEAALAHIDKNKPVNLLVRRGQWVQYVLIRPRDALK